MRGLDEQNLRQGLIRRDVGSIGILERPGSGPSVVFLHGIGSNSRSFALLFERIPPGPRLIAWDAPGYLSSKPIGVAEPTVQDYAIALERLLDGLGLQSAHLVGHSLGTLIAAAFAARVPDRVSSITLAASAQGYGIGDGEPLPENAARRLGDLARLGSEAFAEVRAPGLIFEPDRNPEVVAQVQAEMAKINPAGYAQAVRLLSSGDLSGSVARVRHKPAFIIGAEDRITPREQTDAAIRAWSHSNGTVPECVSIPGAGHAVYLQAPEAFANALQKLIPGLSETSNCAEGVLHDE